MPERPPSANTQTGAPLAIRGLRDWLVSGRAQSADGAYCAWRDATTGSLAFEYPEITGYALTWLAGRRAPGEAGVAAGRRAADWLVTRFSTGDRSARSGWDNGAVYTFDLGMIAAGLISFGSSGADGSYVDLGRDIAQSLTEYLFENGGLPAIAPDGPSSSSGGGLWSTAGRVHLIKCVQALLLAGADGAAHQLVGCAAADQRPDGHFVTQPGDEFVMLHPHLYAVEGLWIWGSAAGDVGALARARRATEWAWQHQLSVGGFPRWAARSQVGPEQLDATSQAIRAAVLLDTRPSGLHAAVDRLAELARADGDYGHAVVYGSEDVNEHLNVWVTMFAEQALTLAAEGPDAVWWNELV